MKTGNPFLDSHIHVVGIPKPDEKKMASKGTAGKKSVASKPVRRTASKPSKGTKRVHSTPRGKKTVSAKGKVKTIKDYRRLHQAIPGDVYAAEVKGAGETQTVRKKKGTFVFLLCSGYSSGICFVCVCVQMPATYLGQASGLQVG